jgi:hypothetical protein
LEEGGAGVMVLRTKCGGDICERWVWKRDFQGAGGREAVEGVVVDIVRRSWVRRVEAMVAGV